LARTDILINVLPLTPETEGLIDAAFLAKLPAGAALIHLGRGGHLDEDALLSALESGHLSGASLDVFRTEPLPRDHPFWSHPRILVTPHVASVPEFEDVARSVRDRLETLPER
ncbi:NAD(P)-dependent oxidoreductase, partial [Pseudooceanicola nanhaiensis]